MEYLNENHKKVMEKSIKAIQEMKKTPANYEEEFARHKKMHETLKQLEDSGLEGHKKE